MKEYKDPYTQHESQIKEIFTLEKLPAISAFLNQFRPVYGEWLKDNEFNTIVHVAQIQAMDDLQKKITQWIINNSKLPQNVKIKES